METLIWSHADGSRPDARLVLDASYHGLGWAILNDMLHMIMLLYTLYGIIRYRLKFIQALGLTQWASKFVIAHTWYLSIKFALISFALHLFNLRLERDSIGMSALNCSFANYDRLVASKSPSPVLGTFQPGSISDAAASPPMSETSDASSPLHFLPSLSGFLDTFGGPFRLLDKRATLLYGVFSISHYIMLAIFPLELLYLMDVGYNFNRFVLGDPSCMEELNVRRERHLSRLASWSRQADSLVTRGVNMISVFRRDLRCFGMATASDGSLHNRRLRDGSTQGHIKVPQLGLDRKLRHLNHRAGPNHQVYIALKNLEMFKPFARDEAWLKSSKIMYLLISTYHFLFVLMIFGLIEYNLEVSLNETMDSCGQSHSDWSLLDKLIYYENWYSIFAISSAASFYCTYYFGTITELSLWIKELSQQLDLSARVIELTDFLHLDGSRSNLRARLTLLSQLSSETGDERDYRLSNFGGLTEIFPDTKRTLANLLSCGPRRHARKGLDRFEAPGAKYKWREQTAIRLLTKRKTLLRATYVNLRLFFDELHETRHTITMLIRRVTLIAGGFAIMASLTKSQFKLTTADYWQLNALLVGVFLIFNNSLACAALINSRVNSMLVKVHSLTAANLSTSLEDADLFEFWLKLVRAIGEERDVAAYNIYGYKVTWASIVNIDSFILTLYSMTS